MSEPSTRSELYQQAFQQAIREHKGYRLHADERGREFIYVAGELLTTTEDAQRVAAKLRQRNIDNDVRGTFGGVTRFVLPRNSDDIPRIVSDLRNPQTWPGERVPHVQPHHVLVGHGGNMHGNPGQPPRVGQPLADPDQSTVELGKGVVVGIVDTGISATAATDHPLWLGDAFIPRVDEEDKAYKQGDSFDLEGGHGTFVAGVVRQAAPGVRFDPEKALEPVGLGTEEQFVRALSSFDEKKVHIVNISMGCFTQDDVASEPVRWAIDRLPADVVVVASAGNQGTSRPSWPAALYRVTAVAAVAEERDGTRAPACYSNHGHWVDACAVGNRTSTYLKGKWELPGMPAEQYDRFAYWLGTSFAAPHVAGRIAATMTRHQVSAIEARNMLLVGQPTYFPGYGVFVE